MPPKTGGELIPNRLVVVCSLVGADLLLLCQAAMMAARGPQPLGAGTLVVAFLCVGLGAWLACLAVLLITQDHR
ncbi:MAG: hypothetical protein HY735_38535 [Verrucomicrobia bacterium]|nr:hypothetical protein [Verrucomicrobiota bacterium]